MKSFMSNPCGCPYCMDWECEKCSRFKPRFLGIPVSRKLGAWLYTLEERLFFKKYIVQDDTSFEDFWEGKF